MIKQDTKVYFKIDDFEGEGKIIGQSLNFPPAMGITYIIQLDYIISEEYPYNSFTCPEIYLNVIEDN